MEKSQDNSILISRAAAVVFALLTVFMIVTLAAVSFFSVLSADDYWHAYMEGVKGGSFPEIVRGAVNDTVYMYLNSQGAYSTFWCDLFNPIAHGNMGLLKIYMPLNVLFFFSALIGFSVLLFRKAAGFGWTAVSFLVFAEVWSLTQFNSFKETFFWYTGSTNYSIPLSFFLILMTLQIIYNVTPGNKKRYLIFINIFCALIAAGGILSIGGSMCYLLLLLNVYFAYKEKRIVWGNAIVFFAAFGFTLMNAAAPGNFVRRGLESSNSLSVGKALADTFSVLKKANIWLFYKNNFWTLFLGAFICGFFVREVYVYRRAYILVSLLALLTQFILVFPVVLGYGVPWMPNRCLFITTVAMTITYINLAVLTGGYVKRRFGEQAGKRIIPAATAAMILLTIISPYQYHRCIALKLNKYMADGDVQKYYADFVQMTEALKEQENCDVLLEVPECPEALAQQYFYFYITDSAEDKLNEGFAWTYNLKSAVASEYDPSDH